MNVLMMVSWYAPKDIEAGIGGIFHYEQAIALKKYCNIAIYYPYDCNITGMTNAVENGVKVYRSQYKLENKLRNRYNMFRAMRRISRDFAPDIIHAQVATEAGRFAVALGKIFRIPVIITEHSTIEASGVQKFPHYLYARFAYRYSEYNVCVSDYLRDRLKEIFPKSDFHTVYNGIKTPEDIGVTRIYRVTGYINMILVACLYDLEIKGIPNLFKVVKRLKSEGHKIKLHIVGDGEYYDTFLNMAVKMGIQEECIFYGRLSKDAVYSVLKQMDFLVSASKFESFGCSIAEAMMAGKPVVATKCGGPESIITDKTGMLVEKEDVQALYEGIQEMIHNYKRYSSEEIMCYAKKRFDIDTISRQYMEIYQKTLQIINCGGEPK